MGFCIPRRCSWSPTCGYLAQKNHAFVYNEARCKLNTPSDFFDSVQAVSLRRMRNWLILPTAARNTLKMLADLASILPSVFNHQYRSILWFKTDNFWPAFRTFDLGCFQMRRKLSAALNLESGCFPSVWRKPTGQRMLKVIERMLDQTCFSSLCYKSFFSKVSVQQLMGNTESVPLQVSLQPITITSLLVPVGQWEIHARKVSDQ